MKFSEEIITKELLEEVKPLLEKHWKEIAFYKDIELNPNYEAYLQAQEAGALRSYSARLDDGKLIGYAVYLVRPNLHYQQCLTATEDIIYVDPDRRGGGLYLLKFADEELKKIGVQVVVHHIKFAHDWSKSLERLGYEKTDMQLCKRLDK